MIPNGSTWFQMPLATDFRQVTLGFLDEIILVQLSQILFDVSRGPYPCQHMLFMQFTNTSFTCIAFLGLISGGLGDWA
jgi:hypothetical protein